MTAIRTGVLWRLLQAVAASLLVATVVAASIPYPDYCEVCAQVHPWWMCVLAGCW